jgi:hypothetical protein
MACGTRAVAVDGRAEILGVRERHPREHSKQTSASPHRIAG